MTLHIDIPPQLEAELKHQAELSGKSQAELLIEAAVEKFTSDRNPSQLNHAEFAAILTKISNRHPPVTGFVDDSRESIYEGRGE